MGLKEEFDTAIGEVMDLMAGDHVTWVDGQGVETELICIAYDLDVDTNPGLVVRSAGWRSHNQLQLDFWATYLTNLGVTINPDGHFLLDAERWDLATQEPMLAHQAPLAGAHSIISVRIRKAVEVNESTPGSEFTYSP